MRPALALQLTRAQALGLEALLGLGLAGALAHRLGAPAWLAGAGLLAGAAAGLRWTGARAASALEARLPELKHALSAWREGAGGTLRPRLEAWLTARLRAPLLVPHLLAAAAALGLWGLGPGPSAPAALAAAPPPAPPPPGLAVQVRVEPPAYAHLPAADASGPVVKALRGSRLTLRWRSPAAAVLVAEPGQPEQRLALGGGEVVQALVLDRSRTLRATAEGGGARLLLELVARPDLPPEVELLAPAEDRVVATAPAPFAVRAQASDDLGLARASLHFTLSQGTGEAVHFSSGQLPARATPAEGGLRLEGRVDPRALGMGPGDTLVLWAEAADADAVDGPQVRRSGARLLRWEVPLPELTGSSGATPPPRSLLTQRELLARTERLVQRGLAGAALAGASAELAQDQRALRTSFDQLLNADTGDALALDVDSKEAAESGDVQARALLAQAVSAMWEAEGELSTGRPRASLPAQRRAVAALDAAFALVRYSLRPLSQPDKPVDEGRRLTGAAEGLKPRPAEVASAPPPEPRLVELALGLLGAAARGLEAPEARALGDALWDLPPAAGVPAPELAAALYGAADPPARAAAARTAGEALARRLRPAHLAIPAADPLGARVVAGLPLR